MNCVACQFTFGFVTVVTLLMCMQEGAGQPNERRERDNEWIALCAKWLSNQATVYAIPIDHPAMARISAKLIGKNVDIAKALVDASNGRWIKVDKALALVPGWTREPSPSELGAYAERFKPILQFLESLTPKQREEMKGGRVVPLSLLTDAQISLLDKAFEARYGRGYKPVERLPRDKPVGLRIVVRPGIRIFVDGVEQPCMNFMWPLWDADFYDSYYYVTIEDKTGRILPWGIENLLPEHLRGYDLLEQTDKEPTPSRSLEKVGNRHGGIQGLDKVSVVLPEARAYTLSELAERVRGSTKIELWVDRRILQLRLLLSKGTYSVATLIDLCCKCYGLEVRRVGEIIFLREGVVPLTGRRNYEGWELHLLCLPLLLPLDEGVQYPGIGFPIESYLQRRRAKLSSLSPSQKTFVENVWWVTRNWNYAHSRFGYGFLVGRRQTAEKYYHHYGPSSDPSVVQGPTLSQLGDVEVLLEPLHEIFVIIYEPSDFIERSRNHNPELRDREDLPKKLYERGKVYKLPLWPIDYSVP